MFEKEKNNYQKNTQTFEENNVVMMKNLKKSSKHQNDWNGPFKVTERLSNGNLEIKGKTKSYIVPTNYLKKTQLD